MNCETCKNNMAQGQKYSACIYSLLNISKVTYNEKKDEFICNEEEAGKFDKEKFNNSIKNIKIR